MNEKFRNVDGLNLDDMDASDYEALVEHAEASAKYQAEREIEDDYVFSSRLRDEYEPEQ